jgi:hypothetical protein
MLVWSENNPTPQIGQLVFVEYRKENGDFENAGLIFVDENITEGKQWMYTQIALIEDIGNGQEVYLGMPAGGMPPRYTRIATDEDIGMFVKYIKEGKIQGEVKLEDWLKNIEADTALLASEKERIKKLLQ